MLKRRSTGNLLIMSAVVVCVCFAMLLGTTFAWFTDTATTQVNTVNTGKFDVQLWGYEADGTAKDLEGITIKFVMADGSPYDPMKTLWEPGSTFFTEKFNIKNAGDYKIKVKIELFSNATATADAETSKTLYDAIKFKIGHFDDNGDFVDSGYIVDNTTSVEFLLGAGTSTQDYIIYAHMDEVAGNEFQGLSISDIALKVSASQTNYENDSDGIDHDANAPYAN